MSGSISNLAQGISTLGGVANNVGGLVRGVRSLGSDLGLLGGLSGGSGAGQTARGLGAWAKGLQVASWNGVRFVVRESTIRRGRRVAIHEYPFRDQVWVEDLGRGTRLFAFRGFLIGDDVFSQRDDMVTAAELPGQGQLIHPSIGPINCAIVEFAATERAELGRVVELDFAFIETAPPPPLPTRLLDTQGAVSIAAATGETSFGQDLAASVQSGAQKLQAGIKTVQGYVKYATKLAGDAGMISHAVAGLAGNFGRYSLGNRSAIQSATSSVSSAIGAVGTARSALGSASSAVNALTSLF